MQLIIKILALTFAIGFASCITDGESYNEPWSIANGSKLPDFSVITSEGREFSTDNYSDKRIVIVFFNTDCNDCRRDLPELELAYTATQTDFVWIAIGRDQNEENAAQFWNEYNLSMPYSAQPDRKIYSLFASEGIPRVYVADESTVVAQFDPEQLPDAETLIKTLNALL